MEKQAERLRLEAEKMEKEQTEMGKRKQAKTAFNNWKKSHTKPCQKSEPQTKCISNGVLEREFFF